MNNRNYFSGLVENDESLTSDVDDSTASSVIKFALGIARIIEDSPIDFEQKEIRFKTCMGKIRQACKISALIDESNSSESLTRIVGLIQDCISTANCG